MRKRPIPLARSLLAALLVLMLPLLASAAVAVNMAHQAAAAAETNRRSAATLATAVRLQQAIARTEAMMATPGLYLGQPAARAAFDSAATDALQVYRELGTQVEPGTRDQVRRAQQAFVDFRAAGLKLADLPGDPFDPSRAGQLGVLLTDMGKRVTTESTELGQVHDAVRDQVSAAAAQVARQQRHEAMLLAGAAAAGTLAAAAAGGLLYRRLVRPLRRLRDASERAAGDQLPDPIPSGGDRELAEVSDAFNAMVERLADSRAALAAREAWFRALVQHSSDLLLVVEVDGTVREVASTEAASEWAAERILGHRLQRFLDPAATTALNAVLTAYQQGEAGDGSRLETVEVQLHTAEGEKRTLELLVADLRSEPAVGGLVLTGRDVTDRTQLVAQLAHQALHDQLTGLANRQLFTDRLEQALRRRAARPDDQVALLYIDLDRFKQINDTLGHAAGDRLLQTVAGRLTMMLRGADTAARLGGDEFAILLDGISGLEEASSIAGRLNAALAEPITLNGDVVSPSASIGVAAVSPSPDARTDVLLANADAAMYAAKQKRGRVVAHPPTLPAQRGVAR